MLSIASFRPSLVVFESPNQFELFDGRGRFRNISYSRHKRLLFNKEFCFKCSFLFTNSSNSEIFQSRLLPRAG